MHCVIYRSPKRDLLYLFVPEREAVDRLPTDLLGGFGMPEFVMELELKPGSRLAQVTADEVIANLERQGFHLQMPPKERHPWL